MINPNYPNPSEGDVRYQKRNYQAKRDSLGRVDLKSLLEVFQNAAGRQIEKLNIGKSFQEKENFLYVVCRVKGRIRRKRKKEESLCLVTYPLSFSSIQSERFCYLLDEDLNPVFSLSSLWVYRDPLTRRRKPVRAAKNRLMTSAPEISELTPLPGFERLNGLDRPDGPYEKVLTHKVSREDIDSNHHRNNTVYLSLAQQVCDLDFSTFEINFEKECVLGEELSLFILKERNVQLIKGIKEDGTLSFKVRFSL